MNKDDPIQDLVPFNQTRLFRADQRGEKSLQTIGNNFGDDLVDHIAEGYRPELIWAICTRFLRDERKERRIESL